MSILKGVIGLAGLVGIDVRRFIKAWPSLIWYMSDKRAFYAQRATSPDKSFAIGALRPNLADREDQGGLANGQYFYQDLLVAQYIYRAGRQRHVDVGSRVDGFVAHVAVFCQVEVIDIRPIVTRARNIVFRQMDLMSDDGRLVEHTDSLSCLHALEHFGLGRYGDPIDFNGHRKGFANLAKMVRPGGAFYFSVPIGMNQRFEFNSHRIFSLPYLLKMFEEQGFEVESFHYVDDFGELHESEDWRSESAQDTFRLTNGCGIFVLKKE